MGKTRRKPETIYIDREQFDLLLQLAKLTRIPRSVLWREALADLLVKYGVSTPPRRSH